ncbi:hypothetical protein ACOME3_000997 [Neoechinorhynchus agilis]
MLKISWLMMFFSLFTIKRVPLVTYPVILIPGYGGSQIEASLNRTTTIHYFCKKQSDWFTLWLNIPLLVWPSIECFADNMILIYDKQTGRTNNNEGVKTRAPGFGDTSTVEYFDPSNIRFSSYFAPIVNRLVKNLMLEHELGRTTSIKEYRIAPKSSGINRNSFNFYTPDTSF